MGKHKHNIVITAAAHLNSFGEHINTVDEDEPYSLTKQFNIVVCHLLWRLQILVHGQNWFGNESLIILVTLNMTVNMMIKSMLLLGLYNWTLIRVELISQRCSVCSMMQWINRFNDQLSAELLIDACTSIHSHDTPFLWSYAATDGWHHSIFGDPGSSTQPSKNFKHLHLGVTYNPILEQPTNFKLYTHFIRSATWHNFISSSTWYSYLILTHWCFSYCLNVFYCFSKGASSPNSLNW